MPENKKILLILSCVFILGLLMISPVYSQAQRERISLEGAFEKTYVLNSGGRFSIDNHNGDIEIESWDRNEVEVLVRERRGTYDEEIEIKLNTLSG